MKIPNLKDSLCQVCGDLGMLPFRAKRIRCLVPLAHNGSDVFVAKGFFRHPWVVWQLLEARLWLWAFRTCTGCKS